MVRADELLEALNVSDSNSEAFDHASLDTMSAFLATFKFHASQGIAGERHVDSEDVFRAILDAAASTTSAHYTVGGNAAIMAQRAHELKADVLLGGPIGTKLRGLLPSAFTFASPSLSGTSEDEIHLIIEYSSGFRLGGATAPRANRFIVVRDATNSRIGALESFHATLPYFDPTAVVFSGLHLLPSLPAEERRLRLESFRNALNHVDKKVYRHLELASMADEKFARLLAFKVFSKVHSLGLNEQELSFFYSSITGDESLKILLTSKIPAIGATTTALGTLLRHFSGPDRTLERIHYHSLGYHVIAMKKTDSHAKDKVAAAAARSVAMGSLACSRRACALPADQSLTNSSNRFDIIVPSELGLFTAGIDFDYVDGYSGVLVWQTDDAIFYGAPVGVCKSPKGTVGLGDHISASGLVGYIVATQDKI